MNPINNRLEKINIENHIWILYLLIIFLSFYSNSLEKDYFLTSNEKSKDLYRKINAFIFIILLFVYGYFEKDSINSLKNHDKSEKQKKLDTLSFIATSAVFISDILFLYIILVDDDLEEEIAFN